MFRQATFALLQPISAFCVNKYGKPLGQLSCFLGRRKCSICETLTRPEAHSNASLCCWRRDWMLWKLLIHMVCVARCAQTKAVHVQATWLLSEFCDKGNIDRALCGGLFRDEACKPQMVRRESITLCHRMLQAVCDPQSHHGLGFGDRPGRSEMPTSLSVISSSCLSANKAGCERQVPPVSHCIVDTVQYQAS